MKKLYGISAVILCLFLSVAVARAEKPQLRGTTMLSCSGLPCADITFANGQHVRLLIDTGDQTSLLDASVAKNLGLDVTPLKDGNGKYGETKLTDVHLGQASLGTVPFLVMDLASVEKKNQLPQADGTLAYTAFKDRLLEMNYKKNKILVSEPMTADPPCSGFCGTITYPTFGNGRPHVLVTTGFSVNGKPMTTQIDTLYAGTLVVYPKSVDQLGLQQENSSATATRFFNYTDGGVPMRESHASKEAFGSEVLGRNAGLFFATPTVHVPDGMLNATAGAGLFANHVLYMDLHSNHFWMTN